jgi:hypothetical protein
MAVLLTANSVIASELTVADRCSASHQRTVRITALHHTVCINVRTCSVTLIYTGTQQLHHTTNHVCACTTIVLCAIMLNEQRCA